MKIVILTGSIPPEKCGVGDYAHRLYVLLGEKKQDVILDKLLLRNFIHYLLLPKNYIINIQYPARGFGVSLLPQLLCLLRKNVVVTIHEYTQARFLRRLAELPFLIFSKHVVTTTEWEKKNFPLIKKSKITAIPNTATFQIGSELAPSDERSGLLFFGLLRPSKGVEEFLQLVALLRKKSIDFKVLAFSSIQDGNEEYANTVLKQAEKYNIKWNINKSFEDVSVEMSKCKYAYLHFPDGVSDRRSSFIAAITHNVVTITNCTIMTPNEIKSNVVCVKSPHEALNNIVDLEKNPEKYEQERIKITRLKKRYSSSVFIDRYMQVFRTVI